MLIINIYKVNNLSRLQIFTKNEQSTEYAKWISYINSNRY